MYMYLNVPDEKSRQAVMKRDVWALKAKLRAVVWSGRDLRVSPMSEGHVTKAQKERASDFWRRRPPNTLHQKRMFKKNCKQLGISLEHIESSVSDEDFKQYVQEATTWHELGVMIANDRLNEDNIFFQCARRDVRKRCDRLDIDYDHLDGIKVGEHDTLYDYRYLNDLNCE